MTIFDIFNFILLILLATTAITISLSKNLLNSIILFSIFSLIMALEYLILSAPDVAITEAAVGVGVGTIIMIGVLSSINEEIKTHTSKMLYSLIIIIPIIIALFFDIQELPTIGASDSPVNNHVIPYYINNTYSDMGIPNIVTAILANYRAFDTLGEVYVIFIAAISVIAILGKDKK